MTEDAAYRALRSLLVEVDAEAVVLGSVPAPLTDILHANQSGPSPRGAYGLVTPLGSREANEGEVLCYETASYQGVPRVVEVRTRGVAYGFRVDVYGATADDTARAFQAALRSARAQTDLLPFVARDIGPVRNSPAIQGQTWEGRADFAVSLAAARVQRTLIDVAETVRIDLSGAGARAEPIPARIDHPREG